MILESKELYNGTAVHFCKLSSSCELIWKKNAYIHEGLYLTAMAGTSLGGYLIAGYQDDGINTKGLIIVTDSTATPIIIQNFDLGGDTYINSICKSTTNDIYIAGYSWITDSIWRAKSFIMRVSETGKQMWKTYFNDSERNDLFTSCVQDDGSIIAAGWAGKSKTPYPYNPWLVKISEISCKQSEVKKK